MTRPKISVITPSIRPKGLEHCREGLLEQTEKDFEWLVDINWTGESDLNASLNRLVKRSKGELLVFLQDYITPPPDGLERFWDAHKRFNKTAFTAPIADDWRLHRKEDDPCSWQEWEIDWGAIPRRGIFDIGGFDEELDKGWGFDNVNAGFRLFVQHWGFINLPGNKATSTPHEDAPTKKARDVDLHNERLESIRHGLQMDYLS